MSTRRRAAAVRALVGERDRDARRGLVRAHQGRRDHERHQRDDGGAWEINAYALDLDALARCNGKARRPPEWSPRARR